MIIRNSIPVIALGYPDLVRKSAEYIQILEAKELPPIDYLFQFYEGKDHDARQTRYLNMFCDLQPGVTQMIIHCGYDDHELQGITSSHFLRGDDTRVLLDPAVKKRSNEMGIQIISWQQLRDGVARPPEQ